MSYRVIRFSRNLKEGITSDCVNKPDDTYVFGSWMMNIDYDEVMDFLYFWFFKETGEEIDRDDPQLSRKIKSLIARVKSIDEKKPITANLDVNGRKVKLSMKWKDLTKTDMKKYKISSAMDSLITVSAVMA